MDRVMIEQEALRQGPHGGGGGDYVFLATEMSFGGKLVKGAPYSAQAVTESVQTLTDGNRIVNSQPRRFIAIARAALAVNKHLSRLAHTLSGSEPTVTVFINDPSAGTSYTLDPRTQTARKMTPMRFRVAAPSAATGEARTAEAREAGVRYREGVTQVTVERSPASASQDYRIAVDAAAVDARRNMEAGIAIGIASPRNRSARNESLGRQNINGVEAEGTRSTVTIPAGEIGNELPIDIVSERRYSPELQVIVIDWHKDPRFGENKFPAHQY